MKKILDNMPYKKEKLEQVLLALETELNRLNETGTDRQKRTLVDFNKILNNVTRNLERIRNTISERQILIDSQCNQKIFHGLLHKKYHETNNLLEDDFNNFFLIIEVALSRFTTLVVELLPHEVSKGIKHAGFSGFIKTIQKQATTEKSLKEIALIVAENGEEIDKTLSTYRDSKIQHVSDNFADGFKSTGMGGIQRIHSKRKDSKLGNPPSKKSDENKIPPTLTLDSSDGKHSIYYLHLKVNPNIIGKPIKKGEELGNIHDNDSGHFEEYGPHGHVFTTPLTSLDNADTYPKSRNIEYSLDPEDAVIKVFEFFSNVLKHIKN